MKYLFAAATFAAAGAAGAQQVPYADALKIVSDGKIISSAEISPNRPAGMGPEPEGTRVHEVFAVHENRLYLCYLIGSSKTGTPPRANCYGS